MTYRKTKDVLAHMRPAIRAAQRAGIQFTVIGRKSGPFGQLITNDRIIAVLCDDTGVAAGSSAFDRASLLRLLKKIDTAIIHAWALEPGIYSAAVAEAIFFGRSVLVIETRLSHEQEWISLVGGCNNVRLVVTTPVGGRA